jgi:hypothetical protein
MTCSACIEYPAQFLATSCHRLMKFPGKLQKIYDDAFLGIPLLTHVNSFSLFTFLHFFRCFAASHMEKQFKNFSAIAKSSGRSSNNTKRNSKQKN